MAEQSRKVDHIYSDEDLDEAVRRIKSVFLDPTPSK